MTTLTSKEIRLAARPVGLPKETDFALAEREVGPPGDGEVLVRNVWMSVDPYMRGRMYDRESYIPPFQVGKALQGGAVGQVLASRAEGLNEGDWVMHMLGWREVALGPADTFMKLPETGLPPELFLGVIGMPGLTAYAGLKRIAELKEGERVFVSGAAGAVGSVVCQIAKAMDCYVVGSAGSDEKCAWLESTAGVDRAINYKTCGPLTAAVREAFPKGLDVYFDNVGGEHLAAALEVMRPFGRAVLCGMISAYNDTTPPPCPANLLFAVGKRLRLQGFIVSDHFDLQEQFAADMAAWIGAGKVKWETTVVEGLENAPGAFLGLFSGQNLGKMLVRL